MVAANMKTRKCKKQNKAVIKPAPRTVDEWWWMLPHNENLQALLIAQLVEELTEQKHLEIRMTSGRIKVAWSGPNERRNDGSGSCFLPETDAIGGPSERGLRWAALGRPEPTWISGHPSPDRGLGRFFIPRILSTS
jgi:hypothetical protein